MLVLGIVAAVLVASPAQAQRSTQAEARLLSLMAGERDRAGAPRWSQADDLTTTAARWSVRMADEYGAEGGQRHNPNLASEVCCARRIAENVGWTRGGRDDLEAAVDRLHATFMGSQGHRANILSSAHTQVGIGVEVHPSGAVYVTVVFREPDGSAPRTAAPSPAPSAAPSTSPPPAPTPSSSPSSAPSPSKPSTSSSSGPDTSRTPDPSVGHAGQAAAATAGSAAPARDDDEDSSRLGEPVRERGELARLARQALAEQDRQVKREVLQELEQTLTSLTLGANRLIDALRWALGLDRTPALEGPGR